MKRRDLLKTTALGARAMVARNVTLAGTGVGGQTPRAPASDRVRVGMIGVGGFGFGANLPDFMKNPDVDIAAICDVYDANLDKALGLAGGKPKRVKRLSSRAGRPGDRRRRDHDTRALARPHVHRRVHHNTYGLNGDLGAARFGSYGIQFHGTKGTLFVDRSGFRITPQTTRREEENQPPPWPAGDSRQPGFYYTTEIRPEVSDNSQQHGPHVRNFLDCVKSRARPNADIEAGHYTNTVCRLGNMAYRLERRLQWDAAREQVVDDAEANRLVVGTYREPWVPRT